MTSGVWSLGFADSRAAIAWRGARCERILRFLFHPSLVVENRDEPPQIDFADDDELVVQRGEDELYRGDCEGSAAVAVMSCAVHELALECRVGPLFHAAALSRDAGSILLPGVTGNGKSTLCGWLACHGFDYLSDELVSIPTGSLDLQALFRPLHLKGNSVEVLERLGCLNLSAADISGLPSDRGRLVPALAFGAEAPTTPRPLRLIVFPRYDPQAKLAPVRLSRAQAGMQLMQNMVNARNLQGHGFKAVTEMVGKVPSYAISYPSFDGVLEAIEQLLASDSG